MGGTFRTFGVRSFTQFPEIVPSTASLAPVKAASLPPNLEEGEWGTSALGDATLV